MLKYASLCPTSAFGAAPLKAVVVNIMMYKVYILKSLSYDWYYTGHTSNLERRLKEHNAGKSQATKLRRPYKIVFEQSFPTKGEAFGREMQIKSFRHGEAFKKLIKYCPVV